MKCIVNVNMWIYDNKSGLILIRVEMVVVRLYIIFFIFF